MAGADEMEMLVIFVGKDLLTSFRRLEFRLTLGASLV